jgi:hypothetical protein
LEDPTDGDPMAPEPGEIKSEELAVPPLRGMTSLGNAFDARESSYVLQSAAE